MTQEELQCFADAQMEFNPAAYQSQMIDQLQRVAMMGNIQFTTNGQSPFQEPSPDIDSMKRANARVLETPKLK